ncbi:hypothetical protein SE17_17980, partial [Kouleothrix aurantiaca]
SPLYNETQTRQEFIDPLFGALGWDIGNRGGAAAAFREVVLEYSMKIGDKTKAPDYLFQLGGTPKFFVEAKKPSVNLKDDTSPAFQLRRYAWSATLPLSVLTDFEEFVVYDCRVEPDKTDKPTVARMFYIPYTEYAEKWDTITELFSREAVLSGSLERFAQEQKAPKGATTVDTAFLHEIEGWRELLAKNIAIWNPELSQRELNYAVQMTLDRIIFLRIAEDRGIETYGQLQGLLGGGQVYKQLVEQFRRADDRYNSGLFHFAKEKGRDDPDGLTPGLYIDEEPLKKVIRNLYYPDSPYEFSVMPVELLGRVYEQFLGKVIHLNAKHEAVVEEKPEVRKAGGVYYTPAYIVEYIVKHTVGTLLEGKTPKDAAKLRIVDPACGSGSFLLGAYQHLLDWHLAQYVAAGPTKHKKELVQGPSGEWRLTSAERKRILLNNIYGVDIDAQAVEVTKLSLSLKVLEGENSATLGTQMRMFQERALPSLENNIKCGNSLIGSDFYDQQEMTLLGEEEQYRINVFDWEEGFPEIMRAGGFDAVIGNPPYGAFFDDVQKHYIRTHYAAYRYKFDSYIYFIEKALLLTKSQGYVSFITPELWLQLENCEPLRKLISETAGFDRLKVCGENVFKGVVVNTVVFVFQRGAAVNTLNIEQGAEEWALSTSAWLSSDGLVVDYRFRPGMGKLVAMIRQVGEPLSRFGDLTQGITPYDKYTGQSPELIAERGYHHSEKVDDSSGRWLAGKDVARYSLGWSGEWLQYGSWLAAPREPRFFEGERLLFREVPGKGKRIQAVLAEETAYYGHSITPFKIDGTTQLNARFLLGIVNSKLISWYGGLTLPNFGKDIFPKLNPKDINALPIRTINFDDPADKKRHDDMVALVERMLDLHKRVAAAKTSQEKTMLQRQIDATDKQIDKLVYELYGLTEEEITIVEGATK